MASEWDEFPDAEPAPRKSKRKRERRDKPERRSDTVAVDGDTLRTPDAVLRLLGADAPELAQQGWNPQGNPVPVGVQSRNALIDLTNGYTLTPGVAAGSSYGRTVAPVTRNALLGDVDLGQQMIRSGNAFAAPDFLSDDPQRRFDYLQAERLARQNALGPVNDNLVRPPAEHRENPDYVPTRETVVQFFDTPTPRAGLSPEVEAGYMAVARTGSAADILAYAEANGFKLDPAQTEAFVKARDGGADVDYVATYAPQIEVLTDPGDGGAGAAVRGFGDEFVFGGLAELGAIPDAIGLTPGRENVWNSDRRFADIVANNYRQNESILSFDDSAHPYASGVGEVSGALTSGFAIPFGSGVRSARGLAGVGAGYGGLSGALGTNGDVADRATGAVIGATAGAVVNPALGKAVEAAAPVVARGYRAVTGRGTPRGADVAGEAAEGIGEIEALEARREFGKRQRGSPATEPSRAPGATERARIADEWAEFPDAPERGSPGAIAMNAEPIPSVSGEVRQRDVIDVSAPVRPQRLDQPLSETQFAAAAERIEPGDVLPVPANVVDTVEEAARANSEGRIVPAMAPDERKALTQRKIRNFAGVEVPKVGPVDLVGFLRLRGGLADQGGELKAMGIQSNAARKGLDFVGAEMRFGPMIREGGMSLDEAADAAWREGYFPELTERPTVNQFLDALRGTYEGTRRRFLPDDLPEIDEFYGRRAARYDLEQQELEAGGPVYVDRSIPADEPQPFAPPEAFEDWPAAAVQRAGNIDLDKLESPQDIRRALVQTNNRVGFDAATRGRVTQAETERLASELGMTADALLSRRKGQALNAEEALAARQILAKSGNELVNAARRIKSLDDPGDELLADFRRKWMRHVAIQEQVSGMTAEAGRALQQFRMAASSRAVRGDVLGALVRAGGGKDNLQEAAETLLDAVESGPGVFNAVAEKAAKPKFRDKLSELYINMLLSGPQTHAVNMASNTLTALAQLPEHTAGALIGGARQAFSRQAIDRITGSEVGARAFGLLQGAKEGARMFARAVKTGEASDFVSKVEGDEYKAISGLKGEVIRVPTRLLTAEDELFKGIARRMELNAQAVRKARSEGLKGEAAKKRIAELVADPTEAMIERATEYGRYLTFQRKLGPAAQDVSNFANRHLVAKVFLPFVRTPTNLLKFAVERSPAAPLLREWRKEFVAGGAQRDLAVARAMLGTGFGMAVYQAALAGRITGSAPTDPKKARLLYADGWKPYSIRIGDTWYSYKRFDPFSTTLGVAADLATLPEGMSQRQRDDKATLLVASIMGNLASKTWLSGLSDLVSALDEPDRYAGNLLERLAGSFLVPTGASQLARVIDPVQRETESVGEAVRNRIPGMSKDLLPRRDIWGREIVNEGGVGPDIVSPVWLSTALDDPVNRELMQMEYAPGYPSRKVGGEELSPEDYDRYLEASGKAAHSGLSRLMGSTEWRGMDDSAKVKAAQKVVRDVRAAARASLFGGEEAPADSWDDFDDVDEPEATSDPWRLFPDASQRDVMGGLERAIPGVRFTSGYRTPEYQADMRARGYNPSPTSRHLQGSALDMLPPPGKSLGWLRREVARVEPDAHLSIHDGHLHAEFRDWQGAPVLGGALSAGLANPVIQR